MRTQPKCRDCHQPIAWFRMEASHRALPFDPKPVDPAKEPRPAYPVEGQVLAWKLRDLIEDLQVRRECSHEDAEAEARDMPHYIRHQCRSTAHAAAEQLQEAAS